jgi:hypothetical protein
MRSHRFAPLTLLLLGFLSSAILAADDAPSPDVTKPPTRAEFLILPLNVHILSSKDHPDIDCKLTDADVERIVGKMNRVWAMAGIAFRIESLQHEPAENLDLFEKQGKLAAAGALGVYRTLCPAESRKLPGLHVYYIHEFPPNGVYLGSNICFIKETANLRKVTGGIDEPLPRVSSHELGHALGLSHRQAVFNLMASGTTGTILNEMEVAHSRSMARKIDGVMTVEECEKAAKEAEKASDQKRSKSMQAALSGLPGAGK